MLPQKKTPWDTKGWVLGVLLGLTLAIGSYAWTSLAADVTRLENSDKVHVEKDATFYQKVEAIQAGFEKIDKRMDRLEDQLNEIRSILIRGYGPQKQAKKAE